MSLYGYLCGPTRPPTKGFLLKYLTSISNTCQYVPCSVLSIALKAHMSKSLLFQEQSTVLTGKKTALYLHVWDLCGNREQFIWTTTETGSPGLYFSFSTCGLMFHESKKVLMAKCICMCSWIFDALWYTCSLFWEQAWCYVYSWLSVLSSADIHYRMKCTSCPFLNCLPVLHQTSWRGCYNDVSVTNRRMPLHVYSCNQAYAKNCNSLHVHDPHAKMLNFTAVVKKC